MKRSAVKTSLFAAEEREHKLDRKGDLLAVLNTHVDFAALAVEMDRIAPRPSETRGGRPPFPTEVMVRVLILQQLYGLSDDALEFQLLDRLSFQRFCGLRQSSNIPDARTVWVFRERIRQAGGAEALFNAVQVQLQRHGYLARGGQIIDASLVSAPILHVNKEDKAILSEQATPASWTMDTGHASSKGHRGQLDQEAWQKPPRLQDQHQHGSRPQIHSKMARQHRQGARHHAF
jgi:transposase